MTAFEAGLTRDQAFELLNEHNKDPFHIEHAEAVEGCLRYFAQEFDPDNVEFWGLVGLLHDLDWEEYPTPEDHTLRTAEMLRAAGGTEQLIHSIQTHNSDFNEACPAPELFMEKVLFAVDELTGLIGAAVIMRPSKSVMDFEVKSLKRSSRTSASRRAARATSSAREPSCAAGSLTSCSTAPSRRCAPSPPTRTRSSRHRSTQARIRTQTGEPIGSPVLI